MRVGIPVADLTAGHFAAQGILIALIEREKSGRGQWLHTSLLQAQIAMLDFQAARYLAEDEVAPQVGNDHPTSVPTSLYPCSDGWANIAVSGEVIWRRFADAIGHPEWIDDPDYQGQKNRTANRDKLNAAIAAATGTMRMSEVVDKLIEAGVPCGPAYRIDETFADPQVQHLGIAAEIDTIPFGRTRLVGQPVRLTRTPTSMAMRPPDRGEHTDEILADLGLPATEIAELRARNIV
jgi:formyl-CoA transferase